MFSTPFLSARQAATKNGQLGQTTAPLASTKSHWSSVRPSGGEGTFIGSPIGAQKKSGIVNARQTRKRLRMSRTIPAMSMPAPWPISWAISSRAEGAGA